MATRRSSGEILRLAKFQVDRPTIDYPIEDSGETPPPRHGTPTKIGRYTVLDLLGVGGMGVVCTAYDPKLDRKIALKLLRKRGKKDDRNSTGQARLIREAQALAKLSHPNIVTVHDVDKFEGQIYMAMEYVEGCSLDQWMIRGQRAWREVLEVFIHAARGLAAAHAASITHRDFKPANVLIGNDQRVLVVDFGLAKSHDDKTQDRSGIHPKYVETPSKRTSSEGPDPFASLRERGSLMDVIGSTRDTKLTQVGRTVGTPAYMAPEQFLGLAVGPETDQFSFGVALFEALYGYLPFPDESRDELVERVTSGRVSEPPKDTPVPGWVHRVVLRALQQRPEDRYPSMHALVTALQADPAKRRRRIMLGTGAIILSVLGTYGGVQAFTPDRNVCTGGADRIHEVWDPTRKATIESAFMETGLSYAAEAWSRVEQSLDARTSSWVGHHTEVCEATNLRREQSPALMDVRMACLERRRGEMRALVEVFQMPDTRVVEEAVSAVQGLEDSKGCLTLVEDTDASIDDPVMRMQAEEIDNMLAQSKARSNSERLQSAIDLAAAALGRARQLGHRPTLARSAVFHAVLRADNTTDAEANGVRDELIEAISLAAETEQAKLEVQAWAKLIVFDGVKRRHPDAGLAFEVPAKMALRRGGDAAGEAMIEHAIARVLSESEDHQAALAAHMRALERYETVEDLDRDTLIAAALSNIGAEHAKLGQLEQARDYLERAATMVESIYGPNHPLLGSIHINLGGVLKLDGKIEEARSHYLVATDLLRRALPSGHRDTLNAMLGLAQTESLLDHADQAQRGFEDVLSVMRAQKEPNFALMASTHNSLGNLLRGKANQVEQAGDLAGAVMRRNEAHEHLAAALEVLGGLPADVRPLGKIKVLQLSMCLLDQDRDLAAEAAEHCAVAWALQQEQGALDMIGIEVLKNMASMAVDAGHVGEAKRLLLEGVAAAASAEIAAGLQVEYAELLWTHEPSRRPEAVTIVEEAERALGSNAEASAALDVVRAWLGAHRG